MTPKIEKLTRDIEKTRTKISELQVRLREMEQQKTELENTEIVALFRSLQMAPDQLPDFVAAMRASASLPETALPVLEEPKTPPISTYSGYTSSFAQEDD